MNNRFDLKRFGQVVTEDWKHYLRRFGITLIVWTCLPILLWITSLVFEVEIDPGSRAGFIAAFIFATVMTVPAHMYGKANLSREGIGFAMLPATNSEKFLSMVLYCSIVTPIFCGLGAWLVDSLMTLLPFGGFKEFVIPFKMEHLFHNLLFAAMVFLTESALFMLGNMIFKKRKTGKTFAWILLIVFVLTLIIQIDFIWNGLEYLASQITRPIVAYWLGIAFLLVLTTCLNLLTYRRIKNQKY
jgi:hypothetical protein